MSTPRKKVLLTGASGSIAGQLLPALREAYDLTVVDVVSQDRAGSEVDDVQICDLLQEDPTPFVELCQGIDTIVHTGYVRPAEEPSYAAERQNVDLMNRVYETALASGVRRVVSASTNQASKWYEKPYYAGLLDRVSPEDYPRPDSFYGWAKAAYESLGFLYASGSVGRALEVVQLRVVVPREVDAANFADRPREQYFRDIAGYISPRDMQQLFVKSIDTVDIQDRFGVPFQIFYGVSNNARTFWSITNAREVIDYQPVDDSEVRFAHGIATMTSDVVE